MRRAFTPHQRNGAHLRSTNRGAEEYDPVPAERGGRECHQGRDRELELGHHGAEGANQCARNSQQGGVEFYAAVFRQIH